MHLVEDEVEDDGGEVEQPSRPQHPRRDPSGDSDGDAAAIHKLFSRDCHVHVLHYQSRPDCQAEMMLNLNIDVVQKGIFIFTKD